MLTPLSAARRCGHNAPGPARRYQTECCPLRWRRTSTRTGAGAAAALFGDLQSEVMSGDDVVTPDHALVLDAQDLVEVAPVQRHEGAGEIRRRAPELGIERREKAIAQIAVGRRDDPDLREPEFIHEAAWRVRLTRSLRPRAWGE